MTGPAPTLPPVLFVGAGRMATAIVKGLLAAGTARPDSLFCTCGDDETGPALSRETGVRFFPDPAAALPDADLVLLACKPQQAAELPAALGDGTRNKLVLSILAGVPLSRIGKIAPDARNRVRVMPNTPAQIGRGVSAYASDRPLADSDRSAVETLLAAMGDFVAVEEKDLDAVTALSGSGPAYCCEFARVLAEAGESLGLPPETALRLARGTVGGAADLLEARSGEPPATLVREVTSPGGTTEAALRVLEGRFAGLFREALREARDRSRELSRA